ncbi:hypothetical protein ABNT06_23105 [Kosakonia sacchari]|uniref:hypothetical protein n=1 Tax=Kosakonia sacchari TaxID=1158459 RepID=UPI0032D8DA74
MGSFFVIGSKPYNNNYGDRGLSVGLNRTASNAMESLFDEALQQRYPAIHKKVMMYLPVDQISFEELSKEELNLAIKEIQACIDSRKEPSGSQSDQKRV